MNRKKMFSRFEILINAKLEFINPKFELMNVMANDVEEVAAKSSWLNKSVDSLFSLIALLAQDMRNAFVADWSFSEGMVRAFLKAWKKS